jgi:RsiW-degrading membrane proteinase PrsW (M82 family)
MAVGTLELAIIIVVAFVPALIYLLWIRAAEIHEREPFLAVEGVFLYGMTIALALAFVLEVVAVSLLNAVTGDTLDPLAMNVILALVFAPIIEEFTKATGVMAARRRLTEPENGLVYGAACGLGFAAGENILYYNDSLASGVEIFFFTVIARTLTSTLLHTSATAITGFGMSRSRCFAKWYGQPRSWFPYYLVAVLLHSVFNFLALLGTDIAPDLSGNIAFFSLFLSLVLVWGTVRYIRRKIVQLDRMGAEGQPIRCD